MSIKLDKRSKYVAPDTMRPAGNCSDSSDFDPAVSASSFATGALTRSSWAGLGRHPPSRAFGSRDPIASGRLLSAMRFAVGGQRTGRCSQRTGSHDIGRPGAVGLGLDRDRSRISVPSRFQEFDGGDLIAHRCIHGLHARRLARAVTRSSWYPCATGQIGDDPKGTKSRTVWIFLAALLVEGPPKSCLNWPELARR